jgi:hypothetical protein
MKSIHLDCRHRFGLLLLAACGGSDATQSSGLPQLSVATGGALASCADLVTKINIANTTITAANAIAAGTLTVAGKPVPAHCQVTGQMYKRVSPVDGKSYAIGFEMRLPNNWNGRFFYQANGGVDGSVVTATGPVGGGGPLDNALNMGFAVISSDAGHSPATPFFGIDPQARLDYGYQAVGKLTPMAKSIIETAYGKKPDRSYIGGCSNGGRHTMVAARATPTSTTASWSETPASACRWRRSPTSPAPRPTTRWRPRRATCRPASRRPSARWCPTRCWANAMRSTAPPTAWCRTRKPARPRST